MKAVVCTPRKFCWHLITKRGEWKKISRSPQRSPWVILRERNLCDIDRIVHKRRRFACARTNTHNLTNFLSLKFFGVCVAGLWSSRGDGCQVAFCRCSAQLALMDLLESRVKLMGKLTQDKTGGLFFSAIFSGSQPHGTLSTPNILHTVKLLIKICFSLTHKAGQSSRGWKLKSAWKGTTANTHSSSLSLISECLSFFLIWLSFLMSGQTCDSP